MPVRNMASYMRDYRKKNRKVFLNKEARLRAEWRELKNELKSTPCVDCGIQYPSYIMQFDHVSGEKKFSIGTKRASKAKLLEEAAKCEIVCANCHMERTYGRTSSLTG